MNNIFESNRINAYRNRERERLLIRGIVKASKAGGSSQKLTGLTALEYYFGLYEPTTNVNYGTSWGWTVPERAWRMYMDPTDSVTRRKTFLETSVPTSYFVRSQRDPGIRYNVILNLNWCDCPYKDGHKRKRSCKHICYIAYRFYIRPGLKLPQGLMQSKGMSKWMSRLLGGICDHVGRPLFDVRTYRRRESLRLAAYMGDDDTLYAGKAILRDNFTDRATGIVCLNNFYGSDANQRAITICNVARAMIRGKRGGNLWKIPCVETKIPGFSWRKVSIEVGGIARQKFFYHVVKLGVTGCSCTCIVFNRYGMVCEHIRAAFYMAFLDRDSPTGEDRANLRDAISIWASIRSAESNHSRGREMEHQLMDRARKTLKRRLRLRTGFLLANPEDHVLTTEDRGVKAFFVGSYDRGTVKRNRPPRGADGRTGSGSSLGGGGLGGEEMEDYRVTISSEDAQGVGRMDKGKEKLVTISLNEDGDTVMSDPLSSLTEGVPSHAIMNPSDLAIYLSNSGDERGSQRIGTRGEEIVTRLDSERRSEGSGLNGEEEEEEEEMEGVLKIDEEEEEEEEEGQQPRGQGGVGEGPRSPLNEGVSTFTEI